MNKKNKYHSQKKKPTYKGTSFQCGILPEPLITFGGNHTHVDPKTGLSLYGPYTPSGQDTPTLSNIIIGVVGPKNMVADAKQWLGACKDALTNDGSNPYANPHFPGISSDGVYQCKLTYGDTWSEVIKDNIISNALKGTYQERLNAIIKLYIESIGILSQREPKPNVIMVCIPQDIIDLCTVRIGVDGKEERIKLNKSEKKHLKVAQTGQTFLWDDLNPLNKIQTKVYDHQNLRRGIKAEAMRHGIPTQIVWPRTLNLNNSVSTKRELNSQDLATKAWNFTTGLYYKAGGTPWRLKEIDHNVCFVGISFYRDIHEKNTKMHSSMAQSFTAAGDGYVLRGKTFEWDITKGRSPHLTRESAKELMEQVIQLYKQQNKGSLPGRIVLHKTSKFWEDELEGFHEACQNIPETDFVAFGYRRIQLFRPGNYPPIRGSFVKIADDNLLLYTIGYVPYFKTYNGPRIPNPIEIVQHIGDSPWNKVIEEILALTKMNWNTASYSCSQPITIAFSKKVGEVLAEMPNDIQLIKPEYRYYM
ncbi:MAG: argonaute/piwi family protein [Flavobacteriales bacterium]